MTNPILTGQAILATDDRFRDAPCVGAADSFWGAVMPCAGKWSLFDSTRPDHHREAAAICATCPLVQAEQCRADAEQQPAPVGTWGGRLFAPAKPTARPSYPREHGTDRGYGQHRYHGENACQECKAAHAAKWRESYGVAA